MQSSCSRSRWLARWRLLTALLSTLGLLAELREPSVWVAAIVPSLVVVMVLVLVVHAKRLLDTLPVVREAGESPLGFACRDDHTERDAFAGEAALDFVPSPECSCPASRKPETYLQALHA